MLYSTFLLAFLYAPLVSPAGAPAALDASAAAFADDELGGLILGGLLLFTGYLVYEVCTLRRRWNLEDRQWAGATSADPVGVQRPAFAKGFRKSPLPGAPMPGARSRLTRERAAQGGVPT